MASPSKLRVMISSRCNVTFSTQEPRQLSQVRKELKKYIDGFRIGHETIFETWINEVAPPHGGQWTSHDVCMNAVRDCDILLVLYNGHSGWRSENETVGICHAEVRRGLETGASKVTMIEMPKHKSDDDDEAQQERDVRFAEFMKKHDLFRGSKVSTIDELKLQIDKALRKAVVDLARGGVRESRRGQGDSGDALDWNRLDYAKRSRAIKAAIISSASDVGGTALGNQLFTLDVAGNSLLFVVGAIPAALSVATAREMVGQPFLQDHIHIQGKENTAGPVHLIGCHKNATEAQAIKMLGFPDATVLTTPFGIYVADQVQKIQFVLLTHCQDETNCRYRFQSMLEWLKRSDEDVLIRDRAMSRANIARAISAEMQT